MERKDMVIIALSIAFLISFIGFIATSVKVARITGEKSEFMMKIRETENLTADLNKNITDLRAMLGKAEQEKNDIKEKLQEASQEKPEDAVQSPR